MVCFTEFAYSLSLNFEACRGGVVDRSRHEFLMVKADLMVET